MQDNETMASIAVVIDSSASIVQKTTDMPLFITIPQTVNIQTTAHADWQLPSDSFYQSITSHPNWYKTSAANPDLYLEAYKSGAEWAKYILCIVPSPKLSAAYNSARIAQEQFREIFGTTTEVRVINSESGGPGMSILILYLSQMIRQGIPIDDIEANLLYAIKKLRFVAVVPSLTHLKASGRVPWIAHLAARALKAKFVIEFSDNRTKLLAVTKHLTTGLERLIKEIGLSELHSSPLNIPITIMNANNPDATNFMLRNLKERSYPIKTIDLNVSAAVATHVGPGFIGAAFVDFTNRK